MMKRIIFGRNNSMVKLQKEKEVLSERAVALTEKLAAAEAELTTATAVRQRHLVEGDLNDGNVARALQDAVNVAASQVVGLEDALASVKAKAIETEHKIEAERASAERAAAAKTLSGQLDEVQRALNHFLDASRGVVSAAEPIFHHFELTQMAAFIANVSSQVEGAAAFVLPELRGMVNAIAGGSAPIPATKPMTAAIVPKEVAAPQTEAVFMLRSAHFLDHEGRKRFAGQWQDATMPPAAAQRALRRGVAVPLTDPRRAELRGTRVGDYNPSGSDVVDLDNLGSAEEPKAAAQDNPAPVQPVFTEIDRSSEARTLQIEVPRF